MNESAYLRRSLSQPTGCSQEEEWDPLRCLSESASFGRFANEPLAWDRWSVFSRNRYLEEAERHSRPGSVAEKKAYFEAHFKKKAEDRAKALLEASTLEITTNVDRIPSVDLKEVTEEEEEELIVVKESAVVDHQNKIDLNIEQNKNTITDAIRASENRVKALLPSLKQAIRSRNRTGNRLAKYLAENKSEKSIHISINFSSQLSKKASSANTRSSENVTSSLNFPKKISDSLQIKPKATTVNVTSKRPQFEARSNLKSTNGKSRSSVVSNPFSFKSEERAAKRKEFYERLEERRKANEAAKRQPQTRYRPKSPKNGRKPSSVKAVDTARASQPLSIKKDQTVSSRSKKNARENSSPNIQSSSSKN